MLNRFFVHIVVFALLSFVSGYGLTMENKADAQDNRKRLINFQISSPHKSQTYSCNLIDYSNQCREYEILASAKSTLEELTEGCESMGGKFQKLDCPSEDFVASCVDIVRNYHRPDVIYNNLYYTGKPTNWKAESVERVCGDLGGEVK